MKGLIYKFTIITSFLIIMFLNLVIITFASNINTKMEIENIKKIIEKDIKKGNIPKDLIEIPNEFLEMQKSKENLRIFIMILMIR